MGAHEVQFPVDISWGSQGGPGFLTNITELDSGREERVQRRTRSRRSYDAAYGVKSYSDLSDLVTFYVARGGVANSFRYKDWLDYNSTAAGKGDDNTSNLDMTIGTGDNSTTTFQLVKRYTSGGNVEVRTITKPVASSLKVAVATVAQTEGVDYSVNTATGVVTFNSAPATSATITAGFEFDVPVRFGMEVDEQLAMNAEDYGSGSAVSIPLIEVFEDETAEDDYFYGGANETSGGVDFSVAQIEGRVQTVDPTSAGVEVTLPALSGVSAGGPIFYFININATNTFDVVEHADDGGSTLVTVAAESGGVVSGCTFVVSKNSAGTKEWRAFV